MANLAKLLQEKIQSIQPWGMRVFQERKLLSSELERTLGFSPRVDVVLEHEESSIRYWIEFEISRADPVANHTKFATSYLFHPAIGNDVFISMVSNHVTRGRKNLGASAISLMRCLGLRAFQTTLFPQSPGKKIKELNHLPWEELKKADIDIQAELDRIITITSSLGSHGSQDIHLAANAFDVYLNVHNWNRNIQDIWCQELWKRRTITYFVYNPWTQDFAPSKFCAYTVLPYMNTKDSFQYNFTVDISMTIPAYIAIDKKQVIFDGYKARKHLVNNLGFTLKEPDDKIFNDFQLWINKNENCIIPSKNGIYFLV
jgi:hypothetical protein